jgi:hypothetical protein
MTRRWLRPAVIAGLFAALVSLTPFVASVQAATPGDLDTSFGIQGMVLTSFGAGTGSWLPSELKRASAKSKRV